MFADHQNWFGIDENLGPVAVTIRRERVPATQDLLTTDTSITSRPANSDHWMYRSEQAFISTKIFLLLSTSFSAQTDRAHERPAAAARDGAGGQHPRAQEREDQDDPHQGGPRVLLPRAATLQVGDSPIELQTMVQRRFSKISQSRRRSLLGAALVVVFSSVITNLRASCGHSFEALSPALLCIEVDQAIY